MWGHSVQDEEGDRSTQAYVWDTAPGHTINFIDQCGQESVTPDTHMLLHNCDCFCGGHTGNAAGDVMIIGGELFGEDQGIRNVNYFKYSTLSWQPAAMMLRARWYPTLVPLKQWRHAGRGRAGREWRLHGHRRKVQLQRLDLGSSEAVR